MLKVMLVDDEELCLQELADFLMSTEKVEIVGQHRDPREALASAEEKNPDVAFIDILIPGLTGLDLAQRLKTQMPMLKVVLISEDDRYALHGFDIGVEDYILKPLRKERVIRALRRSWW